jgi:hypothetical protein
MERVEALEAERQREKDQAKQQQVMQTRQKAVEGFGAAIEKKLTEISPELKQLGPVYVQMVSSAVNGDKAILERFEKGNFTDVDRLFSEFHAQMITFAQAFNAAVLAKNPSAPRIPANTAPPAPSGNAGAKRFNVLDRDERLAAAAEQLQG